jgi:hypothetical protein
MDKKELLEYVSSWIEKSAAIAFQPSENKWWRKKLSVPERRILVDVLRDELKRGEQHGA